MEKLSCVELSELSEFSKLGEVSKVRRFISSELKQARNSHLYSTYWLEMEACLLEASQKLKKNLLEAFLIDYLTIQNNGVITKQENLSKDFINFFNQVSNFQKQEIIIKNIFRYSIYYMKIVFSQLRDDDIRRKIKEINAKNAVDAYPFLMELFEDYEYAHINKEMLLEILDTVIGFIDERNSKKPSQIALSFAGLSGEINKMLVLKNYTPKFVVDEEPEEQVTINSILMS